MGGDKNKYLYNDGAERQEDLGLNIDLTRYRAYDPAIGRWWQIDPKADVENLVDWTPYNYSFNNPIRWNDPLGDCPRGTICADVVQNPTISGDNGGRNNNRFLNDNAGIGRRGSRPHYGIDILASKGTPLKSMMSGTVVGVRNSFEPGQYAKNSTGNFVIVRTELPDGQTVDTKYSHLDAVNENIDVGIELSAGETFGEAGNTGNAANIGEENHHVHVEASLDGQFYGGQNRTDPEEFMQSQFDHNGERIPQTPAVDSNLDGEGNNSRNNVF